MNARTGLRGGIVTIVGFVALAVVPVLALNSLATADTGAAADTADAGAATEGAAATFHALTDAQRQCLAEQGVTLPARRADGSPPELTPEQRAALRRAAVTCGLAARPAAGLHRLPLTDAQRQCLADQGVTLPVRPADGSRPAFSEEQRAALHRAAAACGLPTPAPRLPGAGVPGRI